MTNCNYVDHNEMKEFIAALLKKQGIEHDAARHVSSGLVHASLRGVDSHGIRLLPHYIEALKAGRINPCPEYQYEQTSHATGVLDADNAFGHAAGMEAVNKAVELAKISGIGAVTVKKSTHFGAASFFALEISKHDMIGLSFTHSDSLIIPTGSRQRFLGNNPICFTAPCEGEDPVCLDMATSTITFNKVLQLREQNETAPSGVGADKNGEETTDPHKITSLLPVGGYKGYGLSMMVEVMCALLTGMPFGPHIPRMYDAPIEEKRNLGQFFIAMRIDAFENVAVFKKRMKQMSDELRNEPSLEQGKPVMIAGDPEKLMTKERTVAGLPLRDIDVDFFKHASIDSGIPLNIKSSSLPSINTGKMEAAGEIDNTAVSSETFNLGIVQNETAKQIGNTL